MRFETVSELQLPTSTIADYYIDPAPAPTHIPHTFTHWFPYLAESMDQGRCGSCWAYATTSMLNDRFNLLLKDRHTLKLSPVPLLLCDWNTALASDPQTHRTIPRSTLARHVADYTCRGNTLLSAMRYLYVFGTMATSCVPVRLGTLDEPIESLYDATDPPFCPTLLSDYEDMCVDYAMDHTGRVIGTPARRFRASTLYAFPPKTSVRVIQHEIMRHGPVVTLMSLRESYLRYDGRTPWDGTQSGSPIGDHAVEIVGWQGNYWWVKNSRGSSWGHGGLFMCAMGIGLEDNVITCAVDVFDKEDPPHVSKSNERDLLYTTKYSMYDMNIDPFTGYSYRVSRLYPHLLAVDPAFQAVVVARRNKAYN